MKKNLFSPACFMLTLISILSSCSKQELLEKNPVSETTSNVKNIKLLAAGMGPYDVLGHGYNVTKEYGNASAAGFEVIDINKFNQEQANRLIEESPRIQQYVEEYGEDAHQYSKMISNKVEATMGFSFFTSTVTSSFNSTDAFDAKYIYGSYNLTIKQKRYRLNATVELLKNYLTSTFLSDLQTKTPQQIVQDYGTHILIDIYTGAKLDIMFQAQTNNHNRTTAARAGVKVGVQNKFNLDISNGVDITAANQNFSRKLSYNTRGGDPSQQLTGVVNLDQSTPQLSIAAWQNSSTPENAVFVDIGHYGLILLYDLIEDTNKKNIIKNYIDQYLANNQTKLTYTSNPVYSYYSNQGTDHFSSLSPTVATEGGGYWSSEGIAFNAFNTNLAGTIPVYLYYSQKDADHYFSVSPDVANQGGGYWEYQGIAFYAYGIPNADRKPVYSYYSNQGTDHYISTSSQVAANGGGYWQPEGIAFYVPK